MALFMDGFDYYNGIGTDMMRSIWDSASANGALSAVGNGVFAYGRSANTGTWEKAFANVEGTPGANWSTLYMCFHFQCPTTPNLTKNYWGIFDGASHQLVFRVNALNKLELYRGNGTTLLATAASSMVASTWYWIAIKAIINNNAGIGICVVNMSGSGVGGNQINYAGDTAATANDYATKIVMSTDAGVAAQNGQLDNFHLYDGSDGAPWNAISSERRIYYNLPTGDGAATQWAASAGNRWACVDENPPNGDTDYISTATVTDRNSVTMVALSNISADAVKLSCQVRRDDAGASDIKLYTRIGGTNYDGTAFATGVAYVFSPRTMILDPSAGPGAWTLVNVNAAEWGVLRSS